MGLFGSKKPKEYPRFNITFEKCVGVIGGKIQYFYGIKKIELLTKTRPEYHVRLPKTYNGLPVLAILGQALRSYDFVDFKDTSIIMINANQGNPYGYPIYADFGYKEEDLRSWQGAIFTHDETHPIFNPLSFEPSDITYGCIATYAQKKEIYGASDYEKWLLAALEGNGRETSREKDGLFSFSLFEGEKPDWKNQIRFLVRNLKSHPNLAFKICAEKSSAVFDSYGYMCKDE